MVFTPTAAGTRTGTLTVKDNASNSPQTVTLTGTGVLQATVSPTSLAFGNQAIQTASAPNPVTLTNNLPTALSISSITVTGDYTQTNTCGTALAAGATCTISVTFTPAATGSLTGTLTVTDSASNSPQTASLTGTGVVQTVMSPTSLSFGSQALGTSSVAKTVTLTNNLATALSISSISVSGDYTRTNTCGTSLAPGTNCTISVTFTPTATGNRTGTLTVTDGANNSPQTASLTGTGVLQAAATPASLSFGSQAVATSTAAKTVTLTNNLATALTISSIAASGDYSQTNTCGTSLAAATSCTISVTLTPTITGSDPGTLTITDSANNSPQTVSLAGTGVLQAAATPATLSFGSQALGTSSVAKTVTLTNNLATALSISSISISGDYTQTNTCGTSPAAGTNCTISVTFAPTATGSRTGTLTVTDGTNNSPQTLSLAGTGVLQAAATPASLSFGSQAVATSSAAKTVTLTNNLATALTISSIAASGDYSQTNTCGTSLAAGTNCTISVTLTPTITGSDPGTLTITDSANNSPQTVSLAGTGVVQAAMSPATLSFGNEVVEFASSAKTVTLTNNLATSLSISSIAISGDYSQTNTCGPSLAASSNCTISVTFTPTTTGSRTGTLTVTDSANNSPQTVSLTGNGVVPVSVSPATLAFGNEAVTTTSAPLTVTVSNKQPTAVSITSITTPTAYAQTNTCGTLLAAQGTCTVSVTFSPTTTGSQPGTLTITDNASNSPQTVNLTGTGTALPTITSLSLTSGLVGTSVTITGTGFAGSQGSSTVTFNGVSATPTSWKSTSITTTVPAAATTGNVVVAVAGGASNGVAFTVQPSITSLSTTSGIAGTSVTITGSGFGSSQGSSTATFSGVATTPTSWSASSITAPVPVGATGGSGLVVVTVNGVASNGSAFTVVPNITNLSTASGIAGAAVTITGSGFGSQQGSSTITFNGVSASASSWSPSSITASVPAAATGGSGAVVVTVGGTASNGSPFTVVPNISALSATSGTIGSLITVTGTGFGASQGSSTVAFNGTIATPTAWASGSITVAVPNGAASGNVIVTVGGVASSGVTFTVAPSITSLSATSGIAGAAITITGTGFGGSQGTSTVMFNGVNASPTNWSASSITVPVPSAATAGNGTVVVTVGGIASNAAQFTVVPNITGLSPTSGAVGTTVTISGTSFGSTPGSVTFNGTAAIPTNWTSGSITVPVPAGATTGNVVVTVGGIISNGVSFTVQSLGFVATAGQMEAARYGQTATQLTNGQVLIAGGQNSSGVLNTAEIYALTSQTFAATANAMNVARWLHSATLLNDGTVLIAGGSSLSNETTLNTAEIYDPVAGTFTLLPNTLNTARVGHTATLLSNGQVLIVGGYDPNSGIIADSELYDPTAQVFIDLGNTNTPRFHHAATLLQNGQVLITGGETDPTPSGAYNTAEIFNPTTWTFSPVSANMISGREGHAAMLLNDGTVLITGGDNPPSGSLNTAEIYNSTSNTFTAVSAAMTSPKIFHDAVLLNGGQVLLSGGENDSGGTSAALNTAELYDPTAQTFTAVAGNMTSVREHQTATLLNDGTVLEDGGTDGTNIFSTAEIYTASQLSGLTSITISPASPSVPLGSQQLLTATGTFSSGATQVLSSILWSSSSTSVSAVSNDASDTGFVTTVAQGTATITATAAGISGSATVTVPAPTLVFITINPQNVAMPLGTVQQFTATGTYSDGSTQDLTQTATWTSSSSATTVSAGLVTAAALGTSTIQANFGSQSISATVTVGSPALVSLSVTPSTAIVALGLSQQYQVTGTYTDGSTQNLTSAATWSVVPQTSASANSAGLITGIAQGSITITASYGGFDGVSTLTVGPPNLVSISVSPGAASVAVGINQQFIATGMYADGSTQNLTSSVTWTSSSNTVSTISATGLATSLANGTATISASSGSVTGSATLTVETATLALNTSRYQHNATLLNNGSVLLAGGVNCPSSGSCTYLNSAELYNPNSGTITTTGAMATARSAPAVLLGNGKVLIAGGYTCDSSGNCGSLSSAEIYDPMAGAFSSAGNMTTNRSGHTLTLLNNGQVLIAAGETCSLANSCTALSSAELYNPTAGTFTATGSLNAARFNASAVPLNSGQVLVVGGFDGTNYPATGELYDPVAQTFSNTSTNLNTPRANATATILDNGYVLIAGGTTCATLGCPSSIAEIYQNGSFFYFGYPTSNMTVARWDQTATLLTNGQVLLAGGYDACASSCTSDSTTELFNPQGDSVASSEALSTGRSGHTATLLPDGSVLLIGGINSGTTLSSVDSYVPNSLSLPQLASLAISPSSPPIALGTTLPLTAIGTDPYGDNLGPIASVVWSSSSPSIASVSNAAGSSGIVNSQSAGTTTITASIGSVYASTQVTVTPPLVSLSVSPSNPSVTLNSPQELQLTATGIYSDGSSQNLTANVTWSTSNSSVARVVTSPAVPGVSSPIPVEYVAVAPFAAGTANITATLGNVTGSTSVTVVAPSSPSAPSITGVSPNGGGAGTQVTISGSNFGQTQGGGTVQLGTTLGLVVSWSDTQVVAVVNTGSSSGLAQIQQNSLTSNAVPFTVNTATITGISPNSGLPGTQVTVTGSGFGSIQGGGMVWLGTVPAIVDSWSDGQVIATVANGSTTGAAQVLQNGVLSNSVPFSIDSLQVSGITPNSGSAGTVVTITGGGFGVSQGSGNVWIGNTYGIVAGWSDTQILASVASGTVSGVVKVEQNGAWSNGIAFTVPSSFNGGTPVTLVPNQISMVVGDTRSIQAVDSNGQAVTGLTWTSSNTAVLTLSSDNPPILTAVGAGSATINTEAASADVTVYPGPTLPIGTKIWSNSGDGSGVISIMPAVPSASGGADVFALQNSGVVMALASDGTQLWQANVGTSSTLLPDFQGGLTVANVSTLPYSVQKLDGNTGQAYPAYTYSNPTSYPFSPSVLMHTDGTIFTADNNSIVGIKPTTGNQKFPPVQLEQGYSSGYDGGTCGEYPPRTINGPSPSTVGQGIIAGDGYTYFPYFWTNSRFLVGVCDAAGNQVSWGQTDTHLRILRVGTDGSSMEITLGDWASASVSYWAGGYPVSAYSGVIPYTAGTLITNADQGALYSWVVCVQDPNTLLNTFQYNLTTIDKNGNPTTVPTSMADGPSYNACPTGTLTPVQPVLQRADGSYIGTLPTIGHPMVAFTASGQQLWSHPNDTPQIATSDGGVIGASGTTYDQNGNVTGQIASMPTQSWTDNDYQLSGSVGLLDEDPIDQDLTYSPQVGANDSHNNTAKKQPGAKLILRFGGNLKVSPNDPFINTDAIYWFGETLLGMQSGNFNGQARNGCYAGYELVATVTPSSFTGPVTIKRYVNSEACWIGSSPQFNDPSLDSCNHLFPPIDDTGNWFSTNPSKDPNGQVFNLDHPGYYPFTGANNSPYRQRVNFETYVVDPDGDQISTKINFYTRLSCQNNSNGVAFFSLDVPGDNILGTGTTPTTWNLQ